MGSDINRRQGAVPGSRNTWIEQYQDQCSKSDRNSIRNTSLAFPTSVATTEQARRKVYQSDYASAEKHEREIQYFKRH